MHNAQFKTPLEMLYHWETVSPEAIYLRQPVEQQFVDFTWSQVADHARRIANSLRHMGIAPGSRVALLSKNCAEWFITDFALMMGGYISVPIFATANADTIRYVLEHSEAQAIFVGKLDDWHAQESGVCETIPRIAFPYDTMPAQHQWQDLLHSEPLSDPSHPQLSDLMTIIYTSGSTGTPKGVMHNVETFAWAGTRLKQDLGFSPVDRTLSYLPLAHITERAYIMAGSLYGGVQTAFVESLDTFVADTQRAAPTLFISVPRLWTLFQSRIMEKLPPKKMDLLLKIPLINNLIKRKIRKGLGLEHARILGCGSAPIPPSVLRWYEKLGMNITEAWGMTENAAYATLNFPFDTSKVGSVGRPGIDVEIKIGDNGEILTKSPGLMSGYYRDQAQTAEAFDSDGYLRTGDQGELDSDNFLRITGRVKDIFKTAKGKYVTPVPIEKKLAVDPAIEMSCVIGAGMRQPIAILQLTEADRKVSHTTLRKQLETTFNAVNQSLESHQVLQAMVICDQEWTIENGLMTPTLKIKRHLIEKMFAHLDQDPAVKGVLWESELSGSDQSQPAKASA